MQMTALIPLAVSALIVSSSAALAADVEALPGEKAGEGNLPGAQCRRDLAAFDRELAEAGFGVMPPGGYTGNPPAGYYVWGIEGTPRQKIRSLRNAAYTYAISGNEELCQTVFASMREVYEEHQSLLGSDGFDPDVRTAWRRAHLSRAKPIAQMDHLVRADVLIGSEIRNPKDEKLGDIEDLVLNPEKRNVLYVLVSYGGYFGFGEKLIALRWEDLRATDDHELYVLDASPKDLDGAPSVGSGNFEETANEEWRAALAAYWDRALRQ